MTTFPILRWDAFMQGNSINPKPMIYIRDVNPQDEPVLAVIQDTNSEYDGATVVATIQVPPQGDVGDVPPRAVVLSTSWNGYPPSLGTVTLFDVNGKPKTIGGGDACESPSPWTEKVATSIAPVEPPSFKPEVCQNNGTEGLSVSQIVGVWIALVAIYFIIDQARSSKSHSSSE